MGKQPYTVITIGNMIHFLLTYYSYSYVPILLMSLYQGTSHKSNHVTLLKCNLIRPVKVKICSHMQSMFNNILMLMLQSFKLQIAS